MDPINIEDEFGEIIVNNCATIFSFKATERGLNMSLMAMRTLPPRE